MLDLSSLFSNFLNTVLIVFLLLYLLFSLVVVRQVHLMSKVIITGVDKYVKTFVYLHLIFAIVIIVFLISTLVV